MLKYHHLFSLFIIIIIYKYSAASTITTTDTTLNNKANTTIMDEYYTLWSPWSRCQNCIQKRMKQCINPKCEDSRIYEEKPCTKNKRCLRKQRQKEHFHIVHLYEDSSQLIKQAQPSKIWSKWSDWSPCTPNCRTQRIRICRKPGRCKKKQQEETAYCFHENSNCKTYVINLLDKQHRKYDDSNFYYISDSDNRQITKLQRRRILKKCGFPHRKSRMLKIIGGIEAQRYKWPWHVAILNIYNEVFCGGTLIAPRWILTASHCIRPYLHVRLNEHDLQSHEGGEIELPIKKMFQHPRFNHRTVDNDIALLQLPIAVKLPIACLPKQPPKSGELCSVMGWGKIQTTDTFGINILHETKLPIVHQEVCKRSYRHFLITTNMLCAGWQSGQSDTCAGDSGGGLMCPFQKKKSNIGYTIHGITSFGDGCGLRNKYGIYTTVFNYLKWIYYVMDHYS